MNKTHNNTFDSLIDLINNIYEKLSLFSLLGLTIVVLLQIFFRNVLNYSFSWGGELAIYMNFWLVFLGAAVVFREHGHVKMDFLINKASAKLQKGVELFNYLVTLFFILFFLYSSIKLTNQLSDVVTPAMGMPYIIFVIPPILGFTLMLLIIIKQFIVFFTREARDNR
ncbi:TRAP transporter small permease subunit [Aquibacillus halophilus]|uniref:TRAP transporter small permease subunit n=1 Tax=Aquibacillus halophilus TaxID=930132 RepID=A0A6A8DBV4_9BACI|nr:TRAP transporter small permease [Aquibacillus halophilus]MRH41251.1 TRAP transporter small permease subunit [Aquibacillus halophilus]